MKDLILKEIEKIKDTLWEMADLTITEQGHDALLKGTAAMAYTGYDLIVNKDLLKQIKEEFLNNII